MDKLKEGTKAFLSTLVVLILLVVAYAYSHAVTFQWYEYMHYEAGDVTGDRQGLLVTAAVLEDQLDTLGAPALLDRVERLRKKASELGYGAGSEVGQALADIAEELGTERPNRRLVAQMLSQVADEIRGPQSLFWNHPATRWLEVMAWSLAGILVVRLWSIGKYIGREEFNPNWNWWWVAKIVQAPLLAIAVVLVLSYFELALNSGATFGFTISLRDQPMELVVAISFVLGLYSDKAYEFLEDLADKVLKVSERREELPGKVAVQPSTLMLELGEQEQFTPYPPQDVIWSREPEDLGTLTDGGLYTAPPTTEKDKAGRKVTIKAISATDPTKFATATVVLIKKFETKPSGKEVKFGESRQFMVEVEPDVEWTHEPSDMGSIDAKGKYTAPTKGKPEEAKPLAQVTVIAKSKKDSSTKAQATVTLVDFVVKPDQAEVKFGATQTFSVEPEVDVKWTIEPSHMGSIDATGKYTAPTKGKPKEAEPGAQVKVKATRVDDPASFATATVSLSE